MNAWKVVQEGVRLRLESIDGPIWITPIGLSRWQVIDMKAKRSLGLFGDLEEALAVASVPNLHARENTP